MTLTPVEADAAAAVSSAPATVTVAGRAFPTNRGGLCKKGWTAAELLVSPDRILEPLLRQADGTFEPASWGDALDLVAAKLRETRAAHGADAVGVFGGGGLTNEKAYQLGKFTRVALGSSRIDYNGRFCMSSAAAAGNRAFGLDRGLPFRVDELDAADTILILGSNVAQTMPPFIGHLERVRAAGGLVVVDPRRTATARLTEDGAGMHVQPTPGSDLVLKRPAPAPISSPGAASSSTPTAPTRPPRRSTSASCSASPARPTPATAPSPARVTGRAVANTGRSATSCLATARSPTPPPALTSPRSGTSTPTACPVSACQRSSCSAPWGSRAASAACSCTVPTSSSPRRTPSMCAPP